MKLPSQSQYNLAFASLFTRPAPMDHEVKLSDLFEKIRQLAAARLESATIAQLA